MFKSVENEPIEVHLALNQKLIGFMMKNNNYTKQFKSALIDYRTLIQIRPSVVDTVEIMIQKYFGYARHPLQSVDRLGNPKIDFPIACVYGDRDFVGSDGADVIVKNNKHFSSGMSLKN